MKRNDCDAERQRDGTMYCQTCNLAWDEKDNDPPQCRSVPNKTTQYPSGCSTKPARKAFDYLTKWSNKT